jgi:nucleoside-diphosphate-sugar epimerase
MRIFVAGATGAVGRPMIRQLRAAGHETFAATRRGDKAPLLEDLGAEPVVVDVFDRGALIDAVRAARPDAVVNQLTDLPHSMDPRQLQEIYARNNRVRRDGTANLLDAAEAAGVRIFVAQSMGTWYEPSGEAVKSEAAPLWMNAPEPIGDAIRTVAQMENDVLARVSRGIVLRYGAFYGPGTWYAADGEIAARMRNRGFPIIGRGEGITSFVHVEDAASAAVAALSSEGSGVFNVADDEPAPAAEWIPAYAALNAPKPWKVPVFAARLALGAAMTEWLTTMRGASNAAIKNMLGWRPTYPSWRIGFQSLAAGQM